MKRKPTRRSALKYLAGGAAALGASRLVGLGVSASRDGVAAVPAGCAWSNCYDRVWLGRQFWANPMEDWRVKNGAAECLSYGGNRSIHSLTHSLRNTEHSFQMSVSLTRIGEAEGDGGGGFRLGVRSEIDEYRSNCFVQEGLDVGVKGERLFLDGASAELQRGSLSEEIQLTLSGIPNGSEFNLELKAFSSAGDLLGALVKAVSVDELNGNVALTSNFSIESETSEGDPGPLGSSRYRFRNWVLEGDAFSVDNRRVFGPLLWSMYTLSDSRSKDGFVMKMSTFTGPMGKDDNQSVELQVKKNGSWKTIGVEPLDTDAWVATFKIPNWDETRKVSYRLVYKELGRDGTVCPSFWTGTVRANPSAGSLKMAALTCQKDYGFPYAPVARNVKKLDPDLVFFSGDQIYESHGGFGFIREPAQGALHNFLRKFYQFGWAFREVMRDAPTLCLPDDHDVLQGNLWGEGGAKMQNVEKDPGASVLGGYVEPVRVVNAVHRANLAHHPDAIDPSPSDRGISVYFGELVYGGVGFAILADRQWKSGPERVNVEVGVTGSDEDPDFINPAFNPPGLELLGERQEAWLGLWAKDWRGHSLKAVLSQTVFAGLATHQPLPDRYLKYDFDGSGWPSSARNRAVEIMRPSMALHICGDTHLGTLSQYGVDAQRDSNWAFCTPAISAGWPRWWKPDDVPLSHDNRPEHGLPNTGEYLDSFGNNVYVYAVGNPEVGTAENRYEKAHQKGSGFGIITFDTVEKTYTMEAFRFLIDATDGKASNQFPGWPVTIHQAENRGENRLK